MKRYRFLLEIGIVGGTALVLNYLNIIVCPFYNIIHIPCPGCGLSRAFNEILHLNFYASIQYNILGLPILLFVVFYLIATILGSEHYIKSFLLKHKKIVIFFIALICIVVEIINIRNPLLY